MLVMCLMLAALCIGVVELVRSRRRGNFQKTQSKEDKMAEVSVLGANQQVARIGWGGSCKVEHDFMVKVGSNTLEVTGVNGRYDFSNKRGNYAGSATRRQILAMADAIRDSGSPILSASGSDEE